MSRPAKNPFKPPRPDPEIVFKKKKIIKNQLASASRKKKLLGIDDNIIPIPQKVTRKYNKSGAPRKPTMTSSRQRLLDINKLIMTLNQKNTHTSAWKSTEPGADIICVKLVTVKVEENLNENGMTPYRRTIAKTYTVTFLINVMKLPKKPIDVTSLKRAKDMWKDKGVVYIQSNDVEYILKQVLGE